MACSTFGWTVEYALDLPFPVVSIMVGDYVNIRYGGRSKTVEEEFLG